MSERQPDPAKADAHSHEVPQMPHHILFIPWMGLGAPGIGMLKHHWRPTGLRVL